MRTEFDALRTVAGYRRAIALAIASAAFVTVSFVGVRDLDSTAPVDADSALSMGAVVGFVAVIYAAATTAGELSRGGSRSRCSAILTAGGRSRPGSPRTHWPERRSACSVRRPRRR